MAGSFTLTLKRWALASFNHKKGKTAATNSADMAPPPVPPKDTPPAPGLGRQRLDWMPLPHGAAESTRLLLDNDDTAVADLRAAIERAGRAARLAPGLNRTGLGATARWLETGDDGRFRAELRSVMSDASLGVLPEQSFQRSVREGAPGLCYSSSSSSSSSRLSVVDHDEDCDEANLDKSFENNEDEDCLSTICEVDNIVMVKRGVKLVDIPAFPRELPVASKSLDSQLWAALEFDQLPQRYGRFSWIKEPVSGPPPVLLPANL